MKTESASQKRYTQLYKLINACLERYSEEEMLVMEGYCIFKPDNSNQADKLKEYAETNIFPYYNEQMTAILF